jgi:murein DD-endopeptidase MepM/ murein hydrolase activator NlpD
MATKVNCAFCFPKDTVTALVIDDTQLPGIENLTGEEILDLIDSLLNQDSIPSSLVRQINNFARQTNLVQPVSLTAFYDSSYFPANSLYGKWDENTPNCYDPEIFLTDSTSMLVIEDTLHECRFVPPVINVITSRFGWRHGKMHNGIDIDLEVWDTVRAAFDGMVRVAKYYGGFGRVVVIRHYNGLETYYAHLHRFKVKPGDVVEAGQLIGLGGSSGKSTGSHLHFEIRFKGVPINPENLIDFEKFKLLGDTIILKKNSHYYAAYPKGVPFYTVKKGDYLYKIAKEFGIPIKKLCKINGIKRNQPLVVGQKLRIG